MKLKRCAEKPCPNCPWLKSSTVGGGDIPGFNIEKMRNLANTVPPRGSTEDGIRPIMACHKSREGEEYACAGYIARHGEQNIAVRLMAAQGQGAAIQKAVKNGESVELFEDFHTMLDAYEAAQF